MSTRRMIALLGLALVVVAVVFAVLPVSRHAVNCGSVMSASHDADQADLENSLEDAMAGGSPDVNSKPLQDACDDARSTYRTVALVTVIPGVVLLLGALLVGAGVESPVTDAPVEDGSREEHQP